MPKSSATLITAITQLLRNEKMDTQEKIGIALQKKGFAVNQVKVSRLLHKIGAIKMSEGEQIVYRLPVERTKLSAKDTLRQFINSITHNESLIIIQTSPGAASLVARLLDLSQNAAVLGTVAGDDTIFVAPVSVKKIQSVYKMICTVFQ